MAITGSIVDDELNNTACVEIPMDADVDNMKDMISGALARLSTDDGVLILTDSYGSTPCNIASFFLDSRDRMLVSGLNLPMLVRIMNYRARPLEELKDIAVEGGRNGIVSREE